MPAEGFAWLASATAFAVAMAATPGPNNAMVAASGATHGFARTVPHMLGVSFGFPMMVIAVALGAGELLRTNPMLHATLQWVGAAYLLWLAWRIARAEPAATTGGSAAGRPLTLWQAALFQWVNPKAWIIALGAIATYTTAERVVPQALALGLIFLLVTLPTIALWTMAGVGAARLLRSRRAIRAFNIGLALLLVASLLPLLRTP